jgi:hypothetical protein
LRKRSVGGTDPRTCAWLGATGHELDRTPEAAHTETYRCSTTIHIGTLQHRGWNERHVDPIRCCIVEHHTIECEWNMGAGGTP